MSYFKIISGSQVVVVDLLDHIKTLSFRKVCNELDNEHIHIVAVGDVLADGKCTNFTDMNGNVLTRTKTPTRLSVVSFNGVQNTKYTVVDLDDKQLFHAGIEKWLGFAKNPGFKMGEMAPVLKEVKAPKQKEGWVYTDIVKHCACCGSDIPGIRATKKTQSIFTPAVKATQLNRKWYCECTTTPEIDKTPIVNGKKVSSKEALWPHMSGGTQANVTVTFNGSVTDVAEAIKQMAILMGGNHGR